MAPTPMNVNNGPNMTKNGTKKRRANNSNSNNNQAKAYRKREINLPNLAVEGMGMRSLCGGIARYMKRAQKTFDDASVVSAYLDYTIATNQYGILKNIEAIVKSRGAPNTSSRISASTQVHFFMVVMRSDTVGHAVSVWLILVFTRKILECGSLIHMVKHREILYGVEPCDRK